MQEEEGPPASENQLAALITVRRPLVSASGNGFDEITAERDSGCGAQVANRWPRQETMALLKIRSDMDRVFQEATLKAPLWEEVSRKLNEEGYQRNAKKCKEKFENVFKYYKRTKEARSGKSYRFFTQLETLLSSTTATAAGELPPPIATTSTAMVNVEETSSHQNPFSVTVPSPPVTVANPITTLPPTISLPPTDAPSSSSNTSSFSGTEWEEEDEAETSRKRKRKHREAESGKMAAFFEGLIQKLMDQQEKMLQRFLEAIERREQNRMIREEAWRRQEKSRLSREHELAAQERAAAASRDEAIVSFIEKLTGKKIPFPAPPPIITVPAEETPASSSPPPLPQLEITDQSLKERALVITSRTEPILSSRWPKSEVLALIKLRSAMELRYQESVPKGPLWEEISAGMLGLGYNRSSKRCKEKWENINKYFKKVKESNKSRPEDAKTCPYFHQLDALYRNKLMGGSSSNDDQLAIISPSMASSKQEGDRLGFFEQGSSSVSVVKKPEDTVKKKMEQAIVELESGEKESESSFQLRIQYAMPLVLGGTTLQNNFEFSSMVR